MSQESMQQGATLPDPEALRATLEEALELPALADQRARMTALLSDYERGHAQADAPLAVALVGATGAGKSTLLNALAGRTLAVEGESRPTSTEATIYAPEGLSIPAMEALGAPITRYQVAPGATWSGQVLVDTPDVNSVAQEHRDRAAQALEAADVALVVLHKGSVAEAVQAEFLAPFVARRRVIFVLNFADQYGAASREQLKDQVRALATQQLGLPVDQVEVYAVSAREARAGRDASGEWGALMLSLRAMGERAVAERVRTGNAAGALRALGEAAEAALNSTNELLGAVGEALGDGVDSAALVLRDDFAERLSLADTYLAQLVRRQAAARGWGPAALWMRLSLMGAGGLSAAALVARRSLPGGLAVAAAGTALDVIAGQTRARSARVRVVEEAPGGDVALRAARLALSPARSVAASRGLASEAVGLPDSEALAAGFQLLREEAWARTEGSAIAQAVSQWWRWARWLLLPLVNLPLIALLAHVAWKVIRAYVEGPHLPFDYYMNAIALFAVLAAAGGTLASWTLSGATRRVRRAGVQRFEEGLAESFAPLSASVRSAFAGPTEAARRLTTWGRASG